MCRENHDCGMEMCGGRSPFESAEKLYYRGPERSIDHGDAVDHPAHYTVGGIEVIDFIEAKGLNLHEGSIVQYITRWRYKGGIEDLKKARWYIDRLISLVEKGQIK